MVFRVRLNNIDWYRTFPTELDPALPVVSAAASTPPVPTFRIFGTTETGERVCAHIHGVLPYLYVEYPGAYFGNEEGFNAEACQKKLRTLRQSIDFALHASNRRKNKNRKPDGKITQHVASIALVKGVPFYGYNVGWKLYCKIYLYNPRHINRLAELLLGGAIMSRRFQPYEAHINYMMQFLIDYNLYGCGFVECPEDKLKYRRVHRKECDDDESDYDMSDQEEGYDMLPVDKFPQHSWSGWEVDIQAHHILNRHEIKERNLHHDFEESKKSFGQNFKHVHSLDELWKEHGKHANPSANVEDAWTAPSTAREQGAREEWLQEQDFRAQIHGLAKEEERRSGHPAGLANLIRKIPHEKFIPTAFESVDYISSFGAARGKSGPVSKPAREKMDVDGVDADEDVDVDMKAIYELEEAGLLDFNEEDFAEFDRGMLQELDQNQAQEEQEEQEDDFDARGDSNLSTNQNENDSREGASEMARKKRKHEDDPEIPPPSSFDIPVGSEPPWSQIDPDVFDGTQHRLEEGDTSSYPDKEFGEIDLRSAFGLPSSRSVLHYDLVPPSVSEVVESLRDEGVSRVIYTEPFYGNVSDVPAQSREYGGVRHTLRSHDYIHLPVFNPTGASKRTDGHTLKENIPRIWEYAHKPPSRAEVVQFAAENYPINGGPEKSLKYYPQPWEFSQIEGPTQKNKYGFKYFAGKKKTSKHRPNTSDMTVMSLEIHVNTRGTLKPDPELDPIACIFWCIQSVSGGESQSGILVADEGFTQETFRRFADVEVVVEPDEMYMINSLVDIVRDLDPDILTGYEVHSGSWGYVIERARVINELILYKELSRAKENMFGAAGKEGSKWDYNKAAAIRVTGRHIINIWRAMRGELNLLGYKMENVVYHLLNRRIPHYSQEDLTKWYQSDNPALFGRVLKYYLLRVKLDLEILEKQEFITKISEQARLIGVDFYTVFSRGSQIKVESLMFRIAKPESYLLISPSKAQVAQQNAIECKPLILEPQSNFYTSPVVVLDFQSLYPSVMIAYNYCYSTCLGRAVPWKGTNKMGFMDYRRPQGLLGLMADNINVSPNGILFVKPEVRKSLLAKMLSEILDTRVMIKNRMKFDKDDKLLQQKLNSWQLALKLTANVTYGYTSATFSGRMPCVEIADAIVQSGKETLEKAISLIHSEERWGAEVVYGDTDSLFVHLKGKTKDEAFDIGEEIAERVTAMNPKPIKLKFEKVYLPCVLMAMKRYVGFKYEHRDQKEPEFDAKGIETVRRDGTLATQKMQETALKILFRTSDLSQVKDYCIRQWAKIQQDKVSIQDFCFSKEVKLGTYSEDAPLQPGVKIAMERIEADHRDEPQYGERIPFVVHAGDIEKKNIAQRSVEVQTLLRSDHLALDADYYINKKIIPPLARIFNLVGADVLQWYNEMPKYRRLRRIVAKEEEQQVGKKGKRAVTLDKWLSTGTLECMLCRKQIQPGEKLCGECLKRRDESVYETHRRLATVEKRYNALMDICRSCTGASRAEEIACDSLDCPVFYSRAREETKCEYQKKEAREVLEVLRAV